MENLANYIKIALKRLHSSIYYLLLPIMVRPPGMVYKGSYNSVHRVNIIRFLERWKPHIHGRLLDVGVGGWEYPRRLLESVCDYTTTDCLKYPGVDEVSDIHKLTEVFGEEIYDFVICIDVLEHIQQPWIAVRQLWSVLKPGGTLLLSTPFNFHLHGNANTPDFWRLSADGLAFLLSHEAGFLKVNITSIGHVKFPFGYLVEAQKK